MSPGVVRSRSRRVALAATLAAVGLVVACVIGPAAAEPPGSTIPRSSTTTSTSTIPRTLPTPSTSTPPTLPEIPIPTSMVPPGSAVPGTTIDPAIQDKQAEADKIAARLIELDDQLMQVDARLERAKHRVDELNQEIDDAAKRSSDADATADAHREKLQSYAIEAYITGGQPRDLDALSATQATEATTRRGYVGITSEREHALAEQYDVARGKADDERRVLDDTRAEAKKVEDAIAQDRDRAAQAVTEQKQLKDKVDDELAKLIAEAQARDLAALVQAVSDRTSAYNILLNDAAASVVEADMPNRVIARNALAAALTKLGHPYVWAGGGPDVFDCSGLTMWAWAQVGIGLGHYTGTQWEQVQHISLTDLRPGDLVFFWTDDSVPDHVGMYVGQGQMVHAPHEGAYVRLESILYWPSARMTAGRVIPDPKTPPTKP